jgi:membrane protein CcdC involved in cytochrome C biogenesis
VFIMILSLVILLTTNRVETNHPHTHTHRTKQFRVIIFLLQSAKDV